MERDKPMKVTTDDGRQVYLAPYEFSTVQAALAHWSDTLSKPKRMKKVDPLILQIATNDGQHEMATAEMVDTIFSDLLAQYEGED